MNSLVPEHNAVRNLFWLNDAPLASIRFPLCCRLEMTTGYQDHRE